MFSWLQPALPGDSHGLIGSRSTTPCSTMDSSMQQLCKHLGREMHTYTQYFLWRKAVKDVIHVTSDRRNSRRDQPRARHQKHTPHTYTHTTHIHTHYTQTHTHTISTASHVARYVPALARLLIAEQPVNCTPA